MVLAQNGSLVPNSGMCTSTNHCIGPSLQKLPEIFLRGIKASKYIMMKIVKINNPNISFVDNAYGVSRTTIVIVSFWLVFYIFVTKKETIAVSFII